MLIQVRGLASCRESGTTEHAQSSSPIPILRHELAGSYAPEMERKTFGFGQRLKAAREKVGMSGTTLGIGAGENGRNASKASVSDWEHERHYPKADQLRVICLKLNINVDDLIFGDIREQMQMIQAESAIRALSPEQRQMLIERMSSSAAAPEDVVTNVTNLHVKSAQTLIQAKPSVHDSASNPELSANFLDKQQLSDEGKNGTSHTDKDAEQAPLRGKKRTGKAP